MSLGTVDRTPPPLFRQGTPALVKLLLASALAVLLMVVDTRLGWTQPLRAAIATALLPLQWVAMQPVRGVQWVGQYLAALDEARREVEQARTLLIAQAQRAGMVEYLEHENRELRRLLGLRERLPLPGVGAQILYSLPDPYAAAVVIDRGSLHGVQAGAAVLDGFGVLGQVTRVYPANSEVTLLVHRRQAVPVLNTRTGERFLAYGDGPAREPRLRLRFVPPHTTTQVGDRLVTSGLDGLYPPGLPVGTVSQLSPQGEEGFAEVLVRPATHAQQALHVLVLQPALQAAAADKAKEQR
jgi:rod shape-determining protein MreC